MREIKFRVWDITGKEMIYPDLYWFEEESIREVPGDAYGYQVMQFTGLTDRLGKEIFEGDIVTLPNTDICKIEYRGSMFVAISLTKKFQGCNQYIYWHADADEIIGNLYENGDLLSSQGKHHHKEGSSE